jgi:Flp pilus assembly protein TadB
MRIGSQPRRRRGTVGHPYTALNLRLVLATFGLVICAALAAVLLWRGVVVLGVLAGVLAAIAVVDLVVIQLRRRQRRRTDPAGHSLFE